jgi:hypothetical protein
MVTGMMNSTTGTPRPLPKDVTLKDDEAFIRLVTSFQTTNQHLEELISLLNPYFPFKIERNGMNNVITVKENQFLQLKRESSIG